MHHQHFQIYLLLNCNKRYRDECCIEYYWILRNAKIKIIIKYLCFHVEYLVASSFLMAISDTNVALFMYRIWFGRDFKFWANLLAE